MGIHDRGYYQESGGRRRPGQAPGAWTITTWLIVINIAAFFLQVFLTPKGGGADPLSTYGHFSTHEVLWVGGLEFWRFVTFQFLHGSVTHIAFNMFGLYMFGPMVEETLGGKRFLAFYLVCGIFGAVMYLILNLAGVVAKSYGIGMIPGLLFNSTATPLVGASAGIFGVIMACAYIRPDEKFMLMLPPIEVKVKWLAYGYVAIALVSLFFGATNKGGEAAHVGGAIAGFFFVRNSHLLRDFFDVFDDSREPGGKRGGRGGRGGRMKEKKFKQPKHLKLVRDEGPGDPAEIEIDRILAKISREGRENLTLAEIETLEAATRRKKEGL
jgi:membrane associated rhomboid family serine protease